MPEYPAASHSTIKRMPQRASYDAETIHAILDEGLICHVAFEADGQPFVIPCLYGRDGDRLLLHGAKASRMLKFIRDGGQVSVAVTLIDGLVLARSVFHHSVNYRSVVLFGRGEIIEGEDEKNRALEIITNHILPGRWQEARTPTQKELNATSVVAVHIESASAKLRAGGPGDDEEDYDLPIWAGVLPLELQAAEPIHDPLRKADYPLPPSVTGYRRGKRA